ncbi:hypothetical protein Esi_0023_0125 [Ectocarpus siliculosus]|uniref:Uncharacterized protein n=1 Tax=Ectocarpus siliculosus TaxID=2880 RepID=D8LIY7_ECTSI|nr:hypothetical protein Esi_0023_0125 [Ectocarpus siliculosus]|eukprot:CBN76871.1 hypothetical protein Esi_0023_0125 [Ectocarpus siliculosus]
MYLFQSIETLCKQQLARGGVFGRDSRPLRPALQRTRTPRRGSTSGSTGYKGRYDPLSRSRTASFLQRQGCTVDVSMAAGDARLVGRGSGARLLVQPHRRWWRRAEESSGKGRL